MSQLSFSHVPMAGFAAFQSTMQGHPWTQVDASAYADPSKPLWNAGPLVLSKVRLHRSIQQLLVTMLGAGGAKACDRRWDGVEKQLYGLLAAYAQSSDPAKQDAAERLQGLLLLGNGVAQTMLRYQEEVDFGRKQVALAAAGQGATDVATLGLGATINEIAVATEALAAVIGYGENVVAPHARRRKALAACMQTFGAVAEGLAWLIDLGGDSVERALAMELYASLNELVDRYALPKRASAPVEAAPPSVH